MNLDLDQVNEETEEGKRVREEGGRRGRERETVRQTDRKRERERQMQKESGVIWVGSGSREPGLAGFWWRSVVVQKSSSARRQCVRRGP